MARVRRSSSELGRVCNVGSSVVVVASPVSAMVLVVASDVASDPPVDAHAATNKARTTNAAGFVMRYLQR
jgi:hypothetical protein